MSGVPQAGVFGEWCRADMKLEPTVQSPASSIDRVLRSTPNRSGLGEVSGVGQAGVLGEWCRVDMKLEPSGQSRSISIARVLRSTPNRCGLVRI